MNSPHAVTEIDGKLVYMEDLIMKHKDDEMVIHLNGDTLDNRRVNLRIVKKDSQWTNWQDAWPASDPVAGASPANVGAAARAWPPPSAGVHYCGIG